MKKLSSTNTQLEGFVRTKNEKGETALHCAAQMKKNNLHFPEEDRMIIKLLMENGSDVFIQTQDVSMIFGLKLGLLYEIKKDYKDFDENYNFLQLIVGYRIERQFSIMLPKMEMLMWLNRF